MPTLACPTYCRSGDCEAGQHNLHGPIKLSKHRCGPVSPPGPRFVGRHVSTVYIGQIGEKVRKLLPLSLAFRQVAQIKLLLLTSPCTLVPT